MSMGMYAWRGYCLHFASSFFFNATAPTEIYTLSLHDALPISALARGERPAAPALELPRLGSAGKASLADYRGRVVVLNFWRSEEHTSELQSHVNLVCRLLLEKKK